MLCRNILPPCLGSGSKPNKQVGSCKLNEPHIQNMVTYMPGWEPRDNEWENRNVTLRNLSCRGREI
jgi:hypothetical protein